MANSPFVQSGQHSRYGSPASSQWGGDLYHIQHQQMIPYGPYVSPVPVHAQPQPYGSPPYSHLGRGVSTPPTSTHSQDDSITKRKGRAAKRKNKSSVDKPSVPELDGPLSELTKDMTTPVRDMQAWVNRSDETRQAETEKRNGQIARPMNSFMLYRSAYAERTKQWCTQNNHQVVSAVSGKSWPKETQEVRDFYNELARTERDNHQKAFPGYKFSPSKNNAAASRKRKELEEDDEQVLTEEDRDEYRPVGTRRRPRPRDRNITPDLGYAAYGFSSTPGPMPYRLPAGRNSSMDMTHFGNTNSGQMPHGQAEYYYELPQYPASELSQSMEAARFVPHTQPMQMAHNQSVVGLPGGGQADLLDDQSWMGTPLPDHGHIDPMLMPEYNQAFLSQGQLDQMGAFSERSFRELEGDLATAHYGPASGGSTRGGVMSFPSMTTEVDEQAEFERIMGSKS